MQHSLFLYFLNVVHYRVKAKISSLLYIGQLGLLKQTSNNQEITNWENILITKTKNCIINSEIPPADHLTKKFILNPIEGSRSAPTRKSNSQQSWGDKKMMSSKTLPIYSSK